MVEILMFSLVSRKFLAMPNIALYSVNEFSKINFLTWYFWTFFARMIAQFDTNCLCNKVIFGFEIIQYNSPFAPTINGSDRFDILN